MTDRYKVSNTMPNLSKSRLISAWQCAKRLCLEINARDEQIITPNMQRAFTIGHQAAAAAQTLFPDGHLIEHDHELDTALTETENLLADPGPITLFEATSQTRPRNGSARSRSPASRTYARMRPAS
jgi:hypothetical protein